MCPEPPDPRWPDLPSRSRRRIASDVQQEIDAWLAERAAEWRARGLDPAAAMARAQSEFGDVDGTRDYCVEQDRATERRHALARWLDEAAQDLRVAMRSMRRAPGLTLVLLVTMALGVGATTAIYSVVHGILLRPLPYRDEKRVVQLHTTEDGELAPSGQLSARAYLAMRDRTRALTAVAAIGRGGYAITGDGEPETIPVGRVSVSLFGVTGARPALGTWFAPSADSAGAEPVVILSDQLWRRRYGADPAVVGRSIEMNSVRRRVVGVMPPGFLLPLYAQSQALIPLNLGAILADQERSHKFRFLQLVARVRTDAAGDAAQADVDRVMASLAAERPDAYRRMGARLVTVREEMTGEVRPALLALLGAAVLVLLIACANIASVLLARAVSRRPELAVRAALGAGGARLARQLLAESLALALLGGALGVGVARLGVDALRLVGQNALPRGMTFGVDGAALWTAFALSVGCGVLFGVAPALAARGLATRSVAAGGARGTEAPRRLRLRRSLVVVQVALSVALLAGAGLLGRSLANLMKVDLGYRTSQLLALRVNLPRERYGEPEEHDAFLAQLFERLGAIPGVSGVAISGNIPLTGSSGASLVIEGRPFEGERPPEVRYSSVSDDYFQLMGIPMRRGRGFGPGDESPEVRAALVSESAARRFWGTDDPVGARVKLGPDPSEPWHTVVGVVGDVILGPAGAPQPAVYASMRYDRWGGGDVILGLRGEAAPVRPAVRAAVAAVDPLLPVGELRTVEEIRAEVLSDRRLPLQLVGVFSILAVVLASLGLYGVGSSLVEARRRELGVRMALGATAAGILGLVLRDGLRTVVLGVAVGVPLALLLGDRFAELLYEVRPFDLVTLAGVSGVLLLVGFVAAVIPARRATRVDPIQALRQD
jgi:predicted permease